MINSRSRLPVTPYLFGCDWLLRCLGQLFNGLLVVSKIVLATDENDGKTLAEVQNL
jgi:hypothetical protein